MSEIDDAMDFLGKPRVLLESEVEVSEIDDAVGRLHIAGNAWGLLKGSDDPLLGDLTTLLAAYASRGRELEEASRNYAEREVEWQEKIAKLREEMATEDHAPLLDEFRKALKCMYIECPSHVADDVNLKATFVLAAYKACRMDREEARAEGAGVLLLADEAVRLAEAKFNSDSYADEPGDDEVLAAIGHYAQARAAMEKP